MGSAPSPPKPTDPKVSSAADQQAQTGTAIAQTWMNNPQEFSPFGNISFQRTGTQYTVDAQGKPIEVPTFTRITTLSAPEQAKYEAENEATLRAYNLANQQLGTLSTTLGTPFRGSADTQFNTAAPDAARYQQLGDWNADNYEGYRQRALDTYRQYMQPEIDRQYQARMTELANQGVTLGSEAYSNARREADRAVSDAHLQMLMQAGSEADRAFAIDQARRGDAAQTLSYNNQIAGQRFADEMERINFANALASQQFQKELAERNQPINEMGALLGTGQVNVPQFQQYMPGQIRPTDVAGQYNHYDQMRMAAYQQQLAAHNARMSGLFGLGSAVIGGMFRFSDRRLKTAIRLIGADPRGFAWYAFRYLWDPPGTVREGVMADELAAVIPRAVRRHRSGYLMVDYSLVSAPCPSI